MSAPAESSRATQSRIQPPEAEGRHTHDYQNHGEYGRNVQGNWFRGETHIHLEDRMPSNTPNVEDEHYWVVPRAESHRFVGRESLIERIKLAISPVGKPPKKRIFVINGLGGEGKSELSLQVANRMRQVFWGVFWIDVASRSSAIASFERVAVELELRDSNDRVEQVRTHLAKVGCRPKRNWLLILDNADDDTMDCHEFIPSGDYGSIIITSRSRECRRLNNVGCEELGEWSKLTDHECATLLLAAADREDNPPHRREAKEIADTLGHLPLALILVGAYINRTACSFEEYKSVYERQRHKILQYQPRQGRPRFGSVYATFEASARLLEQSDEPDARNALEFLELLAPFHFKDIPLDLFTDTRRTAQHYMNSDCQQLDDVETLRRSYIPHLPKCLQSDDHFSATLSHLRDLALISENRPNPTETGNTPGFGMAVSMHPLVHEWLRLRRARLNPQEQRQKYLAAIFTLSLANSTEIRGNKWPEYAYLMVPHADWIANKELWVVDLEDPTLLERQLAWEVLETLSALSKRSLALEFSSWVIPIIRQRRAIPPTDIGIMCSVGTVYAYTGPGERRDKGVKLLIQACKAASRLGEAARVRLWAEERLAFAYYQSGLYDEAIKLYDRLLSVHQRGAPSIGDDITMFKAAMAYKAAGNYARAIKLFEEAVQVGATVRHANDFLRLLCQRFPVQVCISDDLYLKLIDLFGGLVTLPQAGMARNHDIRSQFRIIQAQVCHHTGNYANVVGLLQEVFRDQGDTEGETPLRLVEERRFTLCRQLQPSVPVAQTDNPDLTAPVDYVAQQGDVVASFLGLARVEARVRDGTRSSHKRGLFCFNLRSLFTIKRGPRLKRRG